VLYRSNAQSRVIESALFNAGVPYRVYGGLRFFERAEIKHALAYLRLLENPNDDTSFLRVVNFPPRGIGARSMEQLQDAGAPPAARCTMRSAPCPARPAPTWALCRHDRRAARANPGPDPARHHRADAGPQRPDGALPAEKKAPTASRTWKNWSTPPRALSRRKALAAMPWPCRWMSRASRSPAPRKARSARAWTRTPAGAGRAALLAPDRRHRRNPLAAGRLPDPCRAGAGDNQAQAGQDAVQLMTVHASKGLEFDACSSPAWKRACSRTKTP
jgi:DNA helicase-2/ATP-dependent DNA helicase PcrA